MEIYSEFEFDDNMKSKACKKRSLENVKVKNGGKNLGSATGGRVAEYKSKWFQDEMAYLKTLCAPYRHDKTMAWKDVIYPLFRCCMKRTY